jgi:hypothetical protein
MSENSSIWSKLPLGKKILYIALILLMMGTIKILIRHAEKFDPDEIFRSPIDVLEERRDCRGSGFLYDTRYVGGKMVNYNGFIVGTLQHIEKQWYELHLARWGVYILVDKSDSESEVFFESQENSLGWVACRK